MSVPEFTADGMHGMRAAVFHGTADGVRVQRVPIPQLRPTDVLVSVRAVGVGPLDTRFIDGCGQVQPPRILGHDSTGVVAATGEAVERVSIGDEVIVTPTISCGVCGWCATGLQQRCTDAATIGADCDGGWAEFVKVPAGNVAPKPATLTFSEASTLSLSYATAWHQLVRSARVGLMDTVLVMGACTALGTACIDVARLHGARVIGVVDSNPTRVTPEALDTDLQVDFSLETGVAEVMAFTSGRGVDVACGNVGVSTFADSLAVLATGGRLVTTGLDGAGVVDIDLSVLYGRQQSIHGVKGPSRGDIQAVVDLAWSGKWRIALDSTYALDDVREATQRVKSGQSCGAVVMTPVGNR